MDVTKLLGVWESESDNGIFNISMDMYGFSRW
jgi:hypothetical protein